MTNWAIFVAALLIVETGAEPDPTNAVGDAGASYGCLQIQQACVTDVNRVYGTGYVHDDAFEPGRAKAICVRYLKHYASVKRLGRPVTWEDRARIWNGGPNGYKKKATLRYWRRVEAEMRQLCDKGATGDSAK